MTNTRQHWTTFVCVPMDWAIEPPPACALQVWAVLWDHRGKDGQCWPTQERIQSCTQKTPGAPASGLSIRGIRRGLRWLEGHRPGGPRGPALIKTLPGQARKASTYALLWTTNTPPERYAAAYCSQYPDSGVRVAGQDRPVGADRIVRLTNNQRTKIKTRGASAPVCEDDQLPSAAIFQDVVRAWTEAGGPRYGQKGLGPMAITKALEILSDAGIHIAKTSSLAGVVKTWVESVGHIPDGPFVEAVRVYVANVRDKWFPLPAELAAFIDPGARP